MKLHIAIITASLLAAVAGCQQQPYGQQQQQKLDEVLQRLTKLENNQATIAKRVGLAELVRPDAIELGNGIKEGNEDATVAILEFTDLQCPSCKRSNDETMPEIKKQFIDTQKILYVSQDYPLVQSHPAAAPAALALRCVYQQKPDAYQRAKDALFQMTSQLSEEKLVKLAKDMALDSEQFNACRQNKETANQVISSLKYGAELGINSTPTFFIGKLENGKLTDYEIVDGAKPFEHFKQVIDSKMSGK